MLSVLPACEDAPWSQGLRKRPLPPGCLGEYRSAAARAKRLRQELLRLREWEQKVQQEALGALEGSGDSADPALNVEPPRAEAPTLPKGCLHGAEDASDTTSAVHGWSSESTCTRVASVTNRHSSHPAPFCAKDDAPNARAIGGFSSRQATSDPTDYRTAGTATLVHIVPTRSLPCIFACLRAKSDDPSGLSAADGVEEDAEDMVSASLNPLESLWSGACSDGASVQGKPRDEGLEGALGGQQDPGLSVEEAGECEGAQGGALQESLPREETSETHASGGRQRHAAAAASGCCLCAASPATGSLTLPGLPQQFLGMSMLLRLRLRQFLVEASELLGLGAHSLYLAMVMLDCCWTEDAVRRKSSPGRPLHMDASELELVAVACLYHAYCSAELNRPRSLQGFCGVLRNGSDHFPRVAAVLPIRGADVEQHLQGFMDLMPMATAGAVLSSSAWLYASMLGLRGACSQEEHLVTSVAELWTLGYMQLPREAVLAAKCCLATGAVPTVGQADMAKAGAEAHHSQHLQLLQDVLCAPGGLQQTGVVWEQGQVGSLEKSDEQDILVPLEDDASEFSI